MKTRYLNKIIFINSAAIRYAEVQLDGNIHLIGTQGVGKSTILRSVLFFYNADTQKLGISAEKKSYQEYYFPYLDSFIIYEVAREDNWFTVLSYKSMSRVCFRFISSPYDPELFIDGDGVPYTPDKIKGVLDRKNIGYSSLIQTYEEYRNILYGNSDNKRDYSGYSLMESTSCQDIIRTVQNVFLNSRLESDTIKQTIISSLNDSGNCIDLARYRTHLAGFENQLTDISTFTQPGVRKTAKMIIETADEIRKRNLQINETCRLLRGAYLLTEARLPELNVLVHETEERRSALYRQREKLDEDFKARTDSMVTRLTILDKSLVDAKVKRDYYALKDIESVMKRCSKQEPLRQEKESLMTERDILSSKNKESIVRLNNLLGNLKNELNGYVNEQQKQLLMAESAYQVKKEECKEEMRRRRDRIRQIATDEKELLLVAREERKMEIAGLRMELDKVKKGPVAPAELEALTTRLSTYANRHKAIELKIKELKQEWNVLTTENDRQEKVLREDHVRFVENNQKLIEKLTGEIDSIRSFIDNQKGSFFEWLTEHKPGWEQTIGQVCDESVLYGKEFSAEIGEGESFYGIRYTPKQQRRVKTRQEYETELVALETRLESTRRLVVDSYPDLDKAIEHLRRQSQGTVKSIKEDIYKAEYELEQLEVSRKDDERNVSRLKNETETWRRQESARLSTEVAGVENRLNEIQNRMNGLQSHMSAELTGVDNEEKILLGELETELGQEKERIRCLIESKKNEMEQRRSDYERDHNDQLAANGGNPQRLEEIRLRCMEIDKELAFAADHQSLVIEYLKDKRELIDKIPEWEHEVETLNQTVQKEENTHKINLMNTNQQIQKEDSALKEVREMYRKAMENREEYQRASVLDWFTSRDEIFSSMDQMAQVDIAKDCRSLVREVTLSVSELNKWFATLRKDITSFAGNFSENNVFAFKTTFSDDPTYLDFAFDLKEFIEENKIQEYQSRINTRNTDIFRQVTADTKSIVSQEANIRKLIELINADFREKNFVGIIQCIEMKVDQSQNKLVCLLKDIKKFNEENDWDMGQNLFSATTEVTAMNENAINLLKELIKCMDAYKENIIRLNDFFELKFRVVENRNDTGFVERLSNVGSEGTDILVKSMINIMLLNVFKNHSVQGGYVFKLHCMMDEIGKLHPQNMAGILKFANDRDILLINGSPTEQDAMSYKHIYKLEKDKDSFTKIRRVITNFD